MIKQFIIFSLIFISCADAPTDRSSAAAGAVSRPNGQSVFRERCVVCHGADGKLGLNGAKDLTQSALSLEERIEIITNGKKLMTPFGTVLSADEINAVAAYTLTIKQ
ncbi:MAG TPA: cytochrome C [Saprospirales bacterium]|nr:cytochrome C [Saprospirales bacterium]